MFYCQIRPVPDVRYSFFHLGIFQDILACLFFHINFSSNLPGPLNNNVSSNVPKNFELVSTI